MKQFDVPGKTFLFGEYIATQGGPSLVFTSRPCFKLVVEEKQNTAPLPFHPQSPAGLLYLDNIELLSPYQFSFNNPYQLGGLGASTAEFLGLYQFILCLKKETPLPNKDLVKFYQNYNIKNGIAPSGADLIAQLHHGLSYYSPKQNQQQSFKWPYPELSLLLFHTNQKLATHDHLNQVTLPSDLSKLHEIAGKIYKAITACNPAAFVEGIKNYGQILSSLGLEATHTFEILKPLQQDKRILATKGCGAMGADVFLVLCDKLYKATLATEIGKHNYPLLATEIELCN